MTDTFLGEYPNLYADISANSGNNFLMRDPEFAARFISGIRQNRTFGSDCTCLDGRGGPSSCRCIARATLTQLKDSTPEIFRKIAWENGAGANDSQHRPGTASTGRTVRFQMREL